MGRYTLKQSNKKIIDFLICVSNEYKKYYVRFKTLSVMNKVGWWGLVALVARSCEGLWKNTIIEQSVPEVNFLMVLYVLSYLLILATIQFACRKYPTLSYNDMNQGIKSINDIIIPHLTSNKSLSSKNINTQLPLLPKNRIKILIDSFDLSDTQKTSVKLLFSED